MVVTQITEFSKSKCKIYIDGEFAFVLYKGELRQFKIKENEEIAESVYKEITEEILPRRAKLRCLNLMQTKDYTQKQLEDKLRQGEYPEYCIEEALEYVKSYGYINDEKYARDYIEYHLDLRSRGRIEQDLLKKGINKDIIRNVFEELQNDGVEQDEISMILELLKKKNYSPQTSDRKEQQKMYGFLYRKGFHPDKISKALLLDIT